MGKKILKGLAELLLAVAMVVAGYFMLEVSSTASLHHCFVMPVRYILLNVFTIGILLSVLILLTNRVWLASLLCSLCVGVIAGINYYTVMYRNLPLTIQDIHNARTALGVIASYSFEIDKKFVFILGLACGMMVLSALCGWLCRKVRFGWKMSLARVAVMVCVGFLVFHYGYFGSKPVKPKKTITWLWSEAYHQYGYAACTVETIEQSMHFLQQPENYSAKQVQSLQIEPQKVGNRLPDVIIILNETFYDLRQITDLKTDVPYLKNIESMENLLTGYAVTPVAGGGTNNTEYELLTSNSLYLMPGVTPFNVINLKNANSIVQHLETLGYTSLATHSEPGENYSRHNGYSALGFDKAYFDKQYKEVSWYANRWFETDESLYRNLIRWYEEDMDDAPRLMYMLTIQNHGEWTHNAPEYDTVHALNDYGEYDDQVDEYLTLIQQSDQAFADLIKYFSTVDRPVVVCMVGDHSPHFAEKIADLYKSEDDRQLRLRKVPLLIWANYGLEEQCLGTISMNYVVPTLLDIAGITLSPYYQYQLNLKQQVPILASYGKYYDTSGVMYEYKDSQSPMKEAVDQYFHMEYHNLQSGRKQQLFDPYLVE